MTKTVPDRSIRICADRGGTFCDVHASFPDPDNSSERKEIVVKLRERISLLLPTVTYSPLQFPKTRTIIAMHLQRASAAYWRSLLAKRSRGDRS